MWEEGSLEDQDVGRKDNVMGQDMFCCHEHEVMLWDFQEVQTADLIAQWRSMTSPHHYLYYENLP